MYASPLLRIWPSCALSATAYARSMTERSAFGWFWRTAVMSGSSTGLPAGRVAPNRAKRARTRDGVDSSLRTSSLMKRV